MIGNILINLAAFTLGFVVGRGVYVRWKMTRLEKIMLRYDRLLSRSRNKIISTGESVEWEKELVNPHSNNEAFHPKRKIKVISEEKEWAYEQNVNASGTDEEEGRT